MAIALKLVRPVSCSMLRVIWSMSRPGNSAALFQ